MQMQYACELYLGYLRNCLQFAVAKKRDNIDFKWCTYKLGLSNFRPARCRNLDYDLMFIYILRRE